MAVSHRYGLRCFRLVVGLCWCVRRTAEDVAVIFEIMAGHDPLDATSAEVEVIRPERSGAQSKDKGLHGCESASRRNILSRACRPRSRKGRGRLFAQLEILGAEVHEISLPHTEYALPVYYILALRRLRPTWRVSTVFVMARVWRPDTLWDVFFKTRGEKFGAEVTRRIMAGNLCAFGRLFTMPYYGQAQKCATAHQTGFLKLHREKWI